MSEPEEVILDGAHHATTAVAALWRRRSGAERPELLHLADVRARLELFTGAVFDDAPPIGVAEPPAVPNWFGRVALRQPRHLIGRKAVATTDGTRVRLPASLDASGGKEAAFSDYRVMALCLTAKAARGTPDLLGSVEDLLVRDLYLLSESVAVDRWLAAELPGLAPELAAAWRAAAKARPPLGALTPLERRVERLVRTALSSPANGAMDAPEAASCSPGDAAAPIPPPGATPADSLRWATATAEALRAEQSPPERTHHRRARRRRARYRGLPPVPPWGMCEPPPASAGPADRAQGGAPAEDEAPLDGHRVRTLVRRPRVRHAPEDEDDDKVGMWMVQIDDPQESVEDPMGLQRPTDRDDDADAGDLADSLSELPEARLVPVPGRPREVLTSEDPPPRHASAEAGVSRPVGIAYPEWDWRTERYHPKRAIVRERAAAAGDLAWAEQALARHVREVQRVRRRFERLRPQRVRLTRQADGPDVDLSAYVTSHADRYAGRAADDRLYETVRPARRDMSIMLLVDVSGSTDSWVADTRRIVDVEKEALLVVCEALDALGDDYAVMAFSGEGPSGVSVSAVKGFSEGYGALVRRRIAALEPDRFTRTGAAIRHATATLAAQTSRHRLLLVLSDGKPNDVDVYEGRYGVEDTRQAVAEARLQGLHAFCLTVDRQAPVYLPRIFGPSGYAVLRHAATLPQVLVDVVRLLLGR